MPHQQTLEAITACKQRIARAELKLAKQKAKARRSDTRNKILLGGLVIKAKLDGLLPDILLNGLLDLESQICAEPKLLDIFQGKGEAVFLGYMPVPKPNVPLKALRHPEEMPLADTTAAGAPVSLQLTALKQATRRKIQMGGLIIKANLALLNKAQLLGALVTLGQGIAHFERPSVYTGA